MEKRSLTLLGLGLNVVLFGLKFWIALISHSTAVLSDALNSCLDVFSYGVVSFSVSLHELAPDETHHYGHRRAEPLASLLLAVVAVMLGASILKDGVVGLTRQPEVHLLPFARNVLYGSIASKLILVVLYTANFRRTGSTAIRASLIDSRNDIVATLIALAGYVTGGIWDDLAGFGIGAWIIWSGLHMAWPNIHLLMGGAPGPRALRRLQHVAVHVPGVRGVHDLRAHFVGDLMHVEIHIEVDAHLTMLAAYRIGQAVQRRLEAEPGVQRAFVQIDPAA